MTRISDPLWVIGAFDHPELTPYPTHIRPILAWRDGEKYARIFSQLESTEPYHVGDRVEYCDRQNILPYSNLISCEATKYTYGDHVIFLGNGQVLSEKNLLKIFTKLVPFLFTQQWKTTIVTLRNCLEN